ncbi:MAG: hypothetical protein B6I26_08435 [Desulfobacteraceae bacterium 4572_130]|nr:MAG: hypothetical protein B6I26_08435 [Desulfobacteraceae bacterium 4572_130]
MKNFYFNIFNIFILILLTAPEIWSQNTFEIPGENNYITQLEYGVINWTKGKIYATGKAAPSEKQILKSSDYILNIAKTNAINNLILILKTINIGTGNTVEEYTFLNNNIMTGIQRQCMDATIIKQHSSSNRAMEVVVETSMLGGFLQLVLPDEIGQIPQIELIHPDKNKKKQQEYTGLIVDARFIDFKPVLFPIIVSEQGEEIYGSLFISRNHAVEQGICEYIYYSKDLNILNLKTKRAGENPIIIKGLRQRQERKSFIVVSRLDAEKIEKIIERHSFMKKCKVVILLD